jgi:hypothetical protein
MAEPITKRRYLNFSSAILKCVTRLQALAKVYAITNYSSFYARLFYFFCLRHHNFVTNVKVGQKDRCGKRHTIRGIRCASTNKNNG